MPVMWTGDEEILPRGIAPRPMPARSQAEILMGPIVSRLAQNGRLQVVEQADTFNYVPFAARLVAETDIGRGMTNRRVPEGYLSAARPLSFGGEPYRPTEAPGIYRREQIPLGGRRVEVI